MECLSGLNDWSGLQTRMVGVIFSVVPQRHCKYACMWVMDQDDR